MNDFGGRLRAAMLAAGFTTPAEVAARCKPRIPRSTVQRWLTMEEAELSGVHLHALCQCLGVRMRWMVSGRGAIRAATAIRDMQLERAQIILDALGPERSEPWLTAGERIARGR